MSEPLILNRVYNEDNLTTMRRMEDCSVDAVVTDPPYELGFMGKHWDSTGVAYSVEFWKEVLRVLKPGGHLLSFGGSRTYHRMACAIEDAGFEVRDMVEWVYGSGFPKSLDISKAIDKHAGVEREVVGVDRSAIRINAVRNCKGASSLQLGLKAEGSGVITSPTTDSAKQWSGWGTALKPAHEPICMARKPLGEKTVAENVLKYGTGGINVDGCRVPTDSGVDDMLRTVERKERKAPLWKDGSGFKNENNKLTGVPVSGRFPSNLIHDGSEEVVAMFPTNAGAAAPVAAGQKSWGGEIYGKFKQGGDDGATFYADKGSAARFFYCAKASASERNMGCEGMEDVEKWAGHANQINGSGKLAKPIIAKNHHPTVKPIALMKYLITLVTPPGGTVYDPFAGSGSTLIAAKQLGFNYIGSELQPEYCEIANARIAAATQEKPVVSNQLSLL